MNFTAKVTGKRFNLGDYKGLQVPCILQFTAERKFVSILKEHFNLLKEKWKLSAANVRKKFFRSFFKSYSVETRYYIKVRFFKKKKFYLDFHFTLSKLNGGMAAVNRFKRNE